MTLKEALHESELLCKSLSKTAPKSRREQDWVNAQISAFRIRFALRELSKEKP